MTAPVSEFAVVRGSKGTIRNMESVRQSDSGLVNRGSQIASPEMKRSNSPAIRSSYYRPKEKSSSPGKRHKLIHIAKIEKKGEDGDLRKMERFSS